jgi:hypothetical protein
MILITKFEKITLKFMWKQKKTVNNKGNSEKELEVLQHWTSKYTTEP